MIERGRERKRCDRASLIQAAQQILSPNMFTALLDDESGDQMQLLYPQCTDGKQFNYGEGSLGFAQVSLKSLRLVLIVT